MMTDKEGNIIRVRYNGIYLKLSDKKNEIQIFKFIGRDIVKHVKKKNIMKVNGSVGFNYSALKMLKNKNIKTITLICGKHKERISIDNILNNGDFLHFKKEGFEKQIFYGNYKELL